MDSRLARMSASLTVRAPGMARLSRVVYSAVRSSPGSRLSLERDETIVATAVPNSLLISS